MMRWLIALLLILNLATLAWQWDAFARWGWGPHTHQEPERLLKQMRPEALKIEIPAAVESTATAPGTAAPDTGTPLKPPNP
jgi:hypothetical protein